MRVYKFNTVVSADGTIKIPYTPSLLDKEVEVIIVPKTAEKKKDLTAKQFIEKWTGVLKTKDVDVSKYEYLKKKYK